MSDQPEQNHLRFLERTQQPFQHKMILLQLGGVGGGKNLLDPGHFSDYLAAIQGLQQQSQVPKTVSAQPKGSLQASQVVKGREQLQQQGGSMEDGVP